MASSWRVPACRLGEGLCASQRQRTKRAPLCGANVRCTSTHQWLRKGCALRGGTVAQCTSTGAAGKGKAFKGFGAKPKPEDGRREVGGHLDLEVDKLSRDDTKEFFLFARKVEANGQEGKWMPLGDIVLREDASLGEALKERMETLVRYSKGSFVPMRMLRRGERIQIGARLQFGKTMAGSGEIALIDLDNVSGENRVEAHLRLLRKPAPLPTREQLGLRT
mmetsp:Transcript_12785/g.46775  ORF Transcript_12785/g.46775 Transcript_12785/m.46775 type:complete len:221 (-) Transcript_12785:108-770(-)